VGKAVASAAMVTGKRWKQQLLVVLALRSFCPDRACTRLPVYLVVSRETDIAVLRQLLLSLFNADRVLVQSWGQTTFKGLGPQKCIVEDLNTAAIGLFYWIRHFAYHRSLPSSYPVAGKGEAEGPDYGDSVFIIPREFAAAAATWGIVIDLEGTRLIDSPDLLLSGLKDIKDILRTIAPGIGTLQYRSADLEDSKVVQRYLLRGYLLDLMSAYRLEAASGLSGFVDAMRQAWARTVRCSTHKTSRESKDAIIFDWILSHKRTLEQASDDGGYPEFGIANRIRAERPDIFAGLDETELGKTFARHGIGTVRRERIAGAKVSSTLYPRSVIYLSADDWLRMREEVDAYMDGNQVSR